MAKVEPSPLIAIELPKLLCVADPVYVVEYCQLVVTKFNMPAGVLSGLPDNSRVVLLITAVTVCPLTNPTPWTTNPTVIPVVLVITRVA